MSTIDVDTLRQWLESGRSVIVLDVRPALDYADWAIPASIHVDAYQELKAGNAQALNSVPLTSDIPVVAVCGAGRVSQIATDLLVARGIEAYSLVGGMRAWSLAWNSADVPLPTSDTRVIQVRRVGKGCLSYLIGSEDQAAVIDAALEPEIYRNLAQAHGWHITAVLDTHIHADHLSRSRALAEITGATLYLPEQNRVSYPFIPLQNGSVVRVGNANVRAVWTPGHTLESTCYFLEEQVLFSGDTLFLQGVGRPDLLASGEAAHKRASLLYESLQRLRMLPAETLLLPGHSSMPAPFDQQPLAAQLGHVWGQVELLRLSEQAFIDTLLARIPPTPPNHQRIVELNEAGLLAADPVELEAGANRCAVS
jgi:glyoxylase-like metal-dependent hydrolase (beta-lactamase superfamily II)/rhodanese-related sulfurtransferase